jgi:iron complex outermembrane recepter protein
VYAQDLLTYKDLSLLLNFRRTVSTVSADTNYVTFGFESTVAPTTLHENTPGAGVVYRVNQDASLYASFSRGFQQNTDLGCGGGVLPPIRSLNKEVGAKFQLFGDMLSLTTAGFEIQQDNVALYSSSLGCEITQPGQVTRGIELDLQGQLAKGWNAIVNYTHQTARDRSHPDRVFPGAPKNKLNLWTVYDLPFESVKGLGAGLGLTATSQQEGTYMTPYFKIPAQVQLDTSLFYNQPTWHATLGVKNIANRTLYGVSTTNSYIPLLTRRSVMFTFSRDFQ